MKYSPDQFDEVNALLLFDTQNPLDGIKAHSNANPETLTAIKRLFDRDLITQVDGGYLTDSGKKAAEQAHALLGFLK